MQSKNPRNAIWLTIASFLLFSGLAIANIPPAHAAVVISFTNNECSSVTTCSVTPANPSVGDIIVLLELSGSGRTVNTPTDNRGNAYTAIEPCISGTFQNVCIWTTTSGTALSTTITATISGGVSVIDLAAFVLRGVTLNGICAVQGTGTGTGSVSTSNSCTFSGSYFIVGGLVNGLGNQQNGGAAMVPAGWTSCGFSSSGRTCEYDSSDTNGVTSPTSYPGTIAAGGSPNWSDQGLALQVATTAIAACTFFQLQCWWYPFFFMMIYSGFLVLIGTTRRVSANGLTHLFITGLTFGSLIAVILGIMNVVFPLLLLALNTLYILRLKR